MVNSKKLIYEGTIVRKIDATTYTITIDGYSDRKTLKGALKHLAKALEKYSKLESESLIDCVNDFKNELYKLKITDVGTCEYQLDFEDVPCASTWNEENDEMEYKDSTYYICNTIVVDTKDIEQNEYLKEIIFKFNRDNAKEELKKTDNENNYVLIYKNVDFKIINDNDADVYRLDGWNCLEKKRKIGTIEEFEIGHELQYNDKIYIIYNCTNSYKYHAYCKTNDITIVTRGTIETCISKIKEYAEKITCMGDWKRLIIKNREKIIEVGKKAYFEYLISNYNVRLNIKNDGEIYYSNDIISSNGVWDNELTLKLFYQHEKPWRKIYSLDDITENDKITATNIINTVIDKVIYDIEN